MDPHGPCWTTIIKSCLSKRSGWVSLRNNNNELKLLTGLLSASYTTILIETLFYFSDGGGRTGTFCAIVSCIERVKLENNIDLPMTLRNLHAQRKDLIQNEVSNFTLIQYRVVPCFNLLVQTKMRVIMRAGSHGLLRGTF